MACVCTAEEEEMAQDTRRPLDEQPNHASSMEQAEGSRENVNEGQKKQPAAGITNRPLEQERHEQESLPPRGKSKDGGHA
jgi:hypothetical protein